MHRHAAWRGIELFYREAKWVKKESKKKQERKWKKKESRMECSLPSGSKLFQVSTLQHQLHIWLPLREGLGYTLSPSLSYVWTHWCARRHTHTVFLFQLMDTEHSRSHGHTHISSHMESYYKVTMLTAHISSLLYVGAYYMDYPLNVLEGERKTERERQRQRHRE